MKAPLTHHYCGSKECAWEIVNHKNMDGLKCPKCKIGVMSVRTSKDNEHIRELISSGENEANKKIYEDNRDKEKQSMDKVRINKTKHIEVDDECTLHQAFAGHKPKLLTIELDNTTDVPTVYYKGDKIEMKSKVEFKWLAGSAHDKPSTTIDIRHDADNTGKDTVIGYNINDGITVSDF